MVNIVPAVVAKPSSGAEAALATEDTMVKVPLVRVPALKVTEVCVPAEVVRVSEVALPTEAMV
jgi:hypothetical protein